MKTFNIATKSGIKSVPYIELFETRGQVWAIRKDEAYSISHYTTGTWGDGNAPTKDAAYTDFMEKMENITNEQLAASLAKYPEINQPVEVKPAKHKPAEITKSKYGLSKAVRSS